MDRDREASLREIGIVCLAALVYFGVRVIVEGTTARALANGGRILDIEQRVGIDIEQAAQGFVLQHELARVVGNMSYVWLHWPLLIVVLIVLFRRDRSVYVRLRRALIASGLVGLVLFWSVPTAPPRFMPGFEGTVSDAARTHYLGYPLSWANRYASMPSFHVGWTALACLALATTLKSRRARSVAMIPAVLVALAVVTTGNHYVLDAVVGLLIALAAYALAGGRVAAAIPRMAPRRVSDLLSSGYASGTGRASARSAVTRRRSWPAPETNHQLGIDTDGWGIYPRHNGERGRERGGLPGRGAERSNAGPGSPGPE